MNPNRQPASVYEEQLAHFQSVCYGLRQKSKRYGWIRLLSILVPFILAYAFLPHQLSWFLACMLILIILFLYVVSVDTNNGQLIQHYERLIAINEEELKILNHSYTDRDDGKEWEPALHAYAADMDLFGKFSLYQYINRCESQQGQSLLADHLLEPLPFEHIKEYQEAIRELEPQLEWRQQLQSFARSAKFSLSTEERIKGWLQQEDKTINTRFWKPVSYIYPFIPLGAVIFYSWELISLPVFLLVMFLCYSFGTQYSKRVNAIHGNVSRIEPEIYSLQQQILHLEKQPFKSALLQQMQKLIQGTHQKASAELLALKKILYRFDFRLNMLMGPLMNIFLLWDIRQMISMQSWKNQNKKLLRTWIEGMAAMEVLNSLAVLAFNHPQYCFPNFSGADFFFEAKGLGHPLIPSFRRIDNDCSISGTGQIMLITGSNMAGKSTFLRSVGVNTVLAMMGAPVCASSLTLSPTRLISSMRIADNLAENTSTFYAELKKLQMIIGKVNRHEKIFILLDEILRGTNSLDRHTGSAAFLKQLVQEKAVAIVATHDIELSSLAEEYPAAIHNYHFDVQVSGEELYFDYKLKTGICRSMNASILMKKIGIRV